MFPRKLERTAAAQVLRWNDGSVVVGSESRGMQPQPNACEAGRYAAHPRWKSPIATGGSREVECVPAEVGTYSSS